MFKGNLLMGSGGNSEDKKSSLDSIVKFLKDAAGSISSGAKEYLDAGAKSASNFLNPIVRDEQGNIDQKKTASNIFSSLPIQNEMQKQENLGNDIASLTASTFGNKFNFGTDKVTTPLEPAAKLAHTESLLGQSEKLNKLLDKIVANSSRLASVKQKTIK